MAKTRKCLACGTKYSYCPTCSRADALKPSWRSEFCSEPCMEIWTACAKHNMNMLTKDDAKAIILNLDLNPIESYAEYIQRDYAKIMATEHKPKRGKRIEITPADEIMDICQDVTISIIENPVEIKAEQQEVAESHEVVKQENE